jgi:ATP-dependent DNA helicase RecG
MRIGDSLRVMSDAEIFRILSEREPDFSATICEGLTFEDLDPEAIRLMKAGYAQKQGNLAFATVPDNQALADLRLKEFQKSLFTMMDKIWAYINQPASNPLLHIQNKFNIYDIKSFNKAVVREAVINTCVHRSYAFDDDVFIKQYPNELIITNAGDFPPGVSKENILTVNSRPRSKRLTEVLQKTGFIERSGQGVDKMFSLCIMESKPLPDYSNTDSTQVDLHLKAKIIDSSFYLFISKIQSESERRTECI